MKTVHLYTAALVITLMTATGGWAAYHHEGEMDTGKFLEVYPDKEGSKLDHCALCHQGGEYEKKPGKIVQLGSCQWCHRVYGYDGSGGQSGLTSTLNTYGKDYLTNDRTSQAIRKIEALDSDNDSYTNSEEIADNRFPGSENDHPGLTEAPFRIYTLAQLEALDQHTQFMLMNTSRSGDYYAEYTGVPMKELLDDAGILESATNIEVYSADGWSQSHPLSYDESLDMYHVYGNVPGETHQYPPAPYYYHQDADKEVNPDYGWCDYSAPSCVGRNHGDLIAVQNGLKAILALKRDGAFLTPGVLNVENKLDGSGPFRVVVPQKFHGYPDQTSKGNGTATWPYDYNLDHNAGSCSRTATIIKVNPLPQGTTDIDAFEAGWKLVDQKKIIVYGAIDGTDSNGNGILDSEEGSDPLSDFDGDGTPDFRDPNTARFRHAKGKSKIVLNCSNGNFAGVQALNDTDDGVTQAGKPQNPTIPYGVLKFQVTDVAVGEAITLTIVFPENVPTSATYYKITASGWNPIPFDDNDGDNTITITIKDGDPETDADGVSNGIIVDPGALVTNEGAGPDDSDSCFISTTR